MGKVYDGIMGLVVGDALGVPFEFKQRDTFKCTDMIGYGTYGQPAGTWSDDSSLTLATLDSLATNKCEIHLELIMDRFAKWLFRGDYTPHGNTFDVGNTTRYAINKFFFYGVKPEECGGSDISDNGNGSLMRILPLAFIKHSINDIYNLSRLTHAHEISMSGCALYVDMVTALIDGCDKHNAVDEALFYGVPCNFERIETINTSPASRDEIKSTGYVVDTLEAALWCFLNTDNYRDCVLEAVNLGGDTDTIAAVAGGLAGIYYGVGGEKGIPEEWIDQIARKDWIAALCEKLEKVR